MSSDRVPSKSGLSLSERIAALQRKTSNPTSSSYAPASASSSSSSTDRPSPSRNGSASSGARAVRDRMAKFQSSDEKPVMPRSSFGSPAPNPEISHARRQFPGAVAGKGSGAWGEGVLRPQMTGGVWLGAGAGGGWGDPSSASLRPQMTGGAPLGHGNARTQPPRSFRGASDSILHGSGRDAFADLDDDDPALVPRQEATLEAEASSSVDKDLPTLPDTPTAEIDITKIEPLSTVPDPIPENPLPDFPAAPSDVPESSASIPNGLVRSDPTPDTSVEIGVQVRSPGDFEKIRQRAEDLELSDAANTTLDEPWIVPASTDLAGSVPEPLDTSAIEAATKSGDTSVNDQEPWVQGYGAPSSAQDMASAEASARRSASLDQSENSVTAEYNAAGTLPQRAQVARTDSGRVDPNDPAAHEIQGPGLLVPRDEIAEAQALGADAVRAPLADTSQSADDSTMETSQSLAQSSTDPTDDSLHKSLDGQSTLAEVSSVPASTVKAPVPIGRTKSQSQRLRRPPPGTMLSAADLDASDDEYEPGWASVTSVMSSSRP